MLAASDPDCGHVAVQRYRVGVIQSSPQAWCSCSTLLLPTIVCPGQCPWLWLNAWGLHMVSRAYAPLQLSSRLQAPALAISDETQPALRQMEVLEAEARQLRQDWGEDIASVRREAARAVAEARAQAALGSDEARSAAAERHALLEATLQDQGAAFQVGALPACGPPCSPTRQHLRPRHLACGHAAHVSMQGGMLPMGSSCVWGPGCTPAAQL